MRLSDGLLSREHDVVWVRFGWLVGWFPSALPVSPVDEVTSDPDSRSGGGSPLGLGNGFAGHTASAQKPSDFLADGWDLGQRRRLQKDRNAADDAAVYCAGAGSESPAKLFGETDGEKKASGNSKDFPQEKVLFVAVWQLFICFPPPRF